MIQEFVGDAMTGLRKWFRLLPGRFWDSPPGPRMTYNQHILIQDLRVRVSCVVCTTFQYEFRVSYWYIYWYLLVGVGLAVTIYYYYLVEPFCDLEYTFVGMYGY